MANDVSFAAIETPICDAANMADVLYALLDEHFGGQAKDGTYTLTEGEGVRLFFAAGFALSLARKSRDAFYAARNGEGLTT